MKKQTSVEWLIKELWESKKTKLSWRLLEIQALAMHRDEVEDAYDIGFVNGWDTVKHDDEPIYGNSEDYYNKTYIVNE